MSRPPAPRDPMIVLSSGFHRTHMTIAAREASRRGFLARSITGAYPTPGLKRALRVTGLQGQRRLARLLEREEEIPAAEVRAIFTPELLEEAARPLSRLPVAGAAAWRSIGAAMRLYGRLAGRELSRIPEHCEVFHFRAGFGHASIAAAKRRGMLALCDHTAVHPRLAASLFASRGRLADAARNVDDRPAHPLWRSMLDDIDRADAIVVNSAFVKEMFVTLGWPDDLVHVVPLGVDDQFLRSVAEPAPRPGETLELIFAGRFEPAKGAEEIVAALSGLPGVQWRLAIAGPIAPELRSDCAAFLSDPRVTELGTIPRDRLAQAMRAADVFVFPSHAEGSARAVFEALACGCYVITTRNSGSIVEQGVHGRLVEPGESEQLASAIAGAARERALIAEIGASNAALVAERYRQRDYGDGLAALYRHLALSHRSGR